MRVYLDNCCYNRPFDAQTALGDVNAERFIMLMNREPFDYTEWRKDNLFVGETVDSLMDKAEAIYGDLYAQESDDVHQ